MISKRVLNTQHPPLVELGQLASQQHDCISLGQGAPYYHPPDWIFDQWRQHLADPSMHRYTPDPGIYSLRHQLSAKLKEDNQIAVSPDQIILTPGANQAFYNMLVTVADPGDEVILLTPYYFNHYMACQSLNIIPVLVPLLPNFSIDLEAIEQAITPRTKAIVLVNPGNPTGSVHSSTEITQLIDLVKDHRLLLIADETYEYFTYSSSHQSVGEFDLAHTVSLGSFSKTYGIPGWRLGYYFGPQHLVNASLKVQDTIGICAPHPAQILGKMLLEHRDQIIPPVVTAMQANHKLSADLIDEVTWLESTPSTGAYYHFPKQMTDLPTSRLVRQLITSAGVYVVPGNGFGASWSDHLRISFANVDQETLKEAFSRLRGYSF